MFTDRIQAARRRRRARHDRRHRLRASPRRASLGTDRADQRGGGPGVPRRRQHVHPRRRRVGDGPGGAHRVGRRRRRSRARACGRSSAALGAVLVVVGLVTYPVVFMFGIIALLAAAVEWMVQAWSERASADVAFNADVRGRIAHPLEFPILGRRRRSASSSTRSAGSCCSCPSRAARRCSPSSPR